MATRRLDQALKGETITLRRFGDPSIRAQVIRFGLGEGATVLVQETLPGGPVILRKGLQEIAIGRSAARTIELGATS